jgi:hypothetical protein
MSNETKPTRLTEGGIVAAIDDVMKSIGKEDAATAIAAVGILVGGALIDLRTIANAVEKLANANPFINSTEMEALSPAERETIEALRRGDIVVVNNANTIDAFERQVMQHYRDNSGATMAWAELTPSDRQYWREQYGKSTG